MCRCRLCIDGRENVFQQQKTLSQYSLMLNDFCFSPSKIFSTSYFFSFDRKNTGFWCFNRTVKSCFVFAKIEKKSWGVYGNFIDTKMFILRLMPLYVGSRISFGFRFLTLGVLKNRFLPSPSIFMARKSNGNR